MTAVELQALLPLILLAATGVLALLAAAFARRSRAAFAVSGLGLVLVIVVTGVAVTSSGGAVVVVDGLLRVDAFARLYWLLLSAAALAVLVFNQGDSDAGPEPRIGETHGLFVLALLGACVLVASVHFASLFMGLELLSVSLFILIAWHCLLPRSIEAGVKYLVLAGLAAGFALFGMALVYTELGALDFAALTAVEGHGAWWWAGVALLISGLLFKLSLVPFHFWTPDVYQGAPLPVTAFLATVSKIAALALLLRLAATVDLAPGTPWWSALALVAGASMLAGNWLALRQQNLQRLLAYSSIAHMGYALTVVLAGGAFATEAVVFYTFFYAATTLGAFGVLIAAEQNPQSEVTTIDGIRGLAGRSPLLAGIMTLMLLSLAGIPLTGGFVAKFYVLAAGARAELWGLMLLVIAGSATGLVYYMRVVIAMFAGGSGTTAAETRRGFIVPLLLLLTLVVLWLGILPHGAMEMARGVR